MGIYWDFGVGGLWGFTGVWGLEPVWSLLGCLGVSWSLGLGVYVDLQGFGVWSLLVFWGVWLIGLRIPGVTDEQSCNLLSAEQREVDSSR